MIAVTLANPNENSAIEKTTIKGLRSPTTSQLTPRDSFWNPFKDKSKNAPLNVPMRSPLEFPHLLLLTSKMTTRGNLYPCLPPPSIPLLLAKKKKRSIFDSTSSKQSNRSRNADYFAIIICRHWIVKKKEKRRILDRPSRRMRFVAFRWLNGNWIIGHDDRSRGTGAHPVWQAGVWKIHRGGGSINVEQRCFLETLSISAADTPPPRSGVP